MTSRPWRLLLLLAIACRGGPHAAKPQAATSWEESFATCVPGSKFADCVANLRAGNVTHLEVGASEHLATIQQASFSLAAPFDEVLIESDDQGLQIDSVQISQKLEVGRARKQLVEVLRSQLEPKAKPYRPWGRGCGVPGWGIGWQMAPTGASVVEALVKSTGNEEDDPLDPDPKWKKKMAKVNPEETLIKEAGAGVVSVCFIWQASAPDLAATAMQGYLRSPVFHGNARLKP